MIPFCVKQASEFGLCVAYIVLHKRDRTGEILVEEVGMNIAVAITFAAVVLCGWTVVFIALRELKRGL